MQSSKPWSLKGFIESSLGDAHRYWVGQHVGDAQPLPTTMLTMKMKLFMTARFLPVTVHPETNNTVTHQTENY